ncbi:hypothetical protein [Catenovulum maritimum]|uniref:Uncharacterized protein n=1 Tax=Catenovulum maritimum TaxID=1513271 RepID=A0A0J8GWC9_9ALTE|nr:hypothetical protein [Catenovulum maritimum]KMT67057.1 hypothetical protein XM47_00220 [Catenovulum maritimum]
MSMSLFVVLALEVEPNSNTLNLSAKEFGYNIEYSKNVELKRHTGFLPAVLDNQKTGVELYSFLADELPNQFKVLVPTDYQQGFVYQLKFSGDAMEVKTAFTTAIILNTKYNGVAIEDQSGALLSVEQLTQSLAYFSSM